MPPNLQKHFGESRICTPKPQLAMCTACLKGFSFLMGRGGDGKKRPTKYNLSPVQIVIIKGHHMTQYTDAFPRRNCADFSGQGRALKGREIAQPFVLNN
jgi:hypothetical protein